ncbi:cytochrome C [Roseivivax halodurans JCM 10272]|uniref:Cytochrome C n=1 Tax=Roseivivax halodurans JCM 10272 TaxID=1449350 RepID=X7EL29_9RHOB|nr:c-type cytochrome [Roseivivax halodurans]ETX16595.1 cytochrome C [Roseivivax halodurans JCM 10272]
MKLRRPDLDPETIAWTLGTLAVAGAVVGASVVGFGLYNVSARSGHLPGVSWALHTTFRQSVERQAPPKSEVPELTPEMAALGARHFEAACAVCHSAPGRNRTATMEVMNPVPPHIEVASRNWDPEEFHWIVDEGVKMSGMPAWPADREPEVWPVVAFLMDVQDGMTGEEYEALTRMEGGSAEGFEYCAACHGERGATDNPHIPRLDILSAEYMSVALDAYARGARDSGFMEHAASEVPRETLADLAARFAEYQPSGDAGDMSELAGEGRTLAYAEGGDSNVPSCRACHGPWPEPIKESFPALAGQHAPYLEAQLKLWRDGARGGGPTQELMHSAARELSDEDIAALAAYYAALAPATLNETAERP